MPQFDQMYYDQKWSVYDTWRAFGRNVRIYTMTAAKRMVETVTASKRRVETISAQNRRVETITGV